MTGEVGATSVSGVREPFLVVIHEDDAGLGRLAPYLPGSHLCRPYRGDRLPTDIDGYAGLLVLGGSMGAWDDEVAPWLPATRRLLAEGVRRELPTLGICLGAQLLAAATGGRVDRDEAGLEVGLVPVELLPAAAADTLFGALVEPGAWTARSRTPRIDVAQWHQDAVVDLPPDAVLLARGNRYPHQAFRLGPRAWGLQYHPEVTLADFSAWMQGGHGAVRDLGLDPDVLLAGFDAADTELDDIAERHACAFAGLLAPGERRRLRGPARPG